MTRNVKRIAMSLMVFSALILVSCSSANYTAYSKEMHTGKNFMQDQENEKAK